MGEAGTASHYFSLARDTRPPCHWRKHPRAPCCLEELRFAACNIEGAYSTIVTRNKCHLRSFVICPLQHTARALVSRGLIVWRVDLASTTPWSLPASPTLLSQDDLVHCAHRRLVAILPSTHSTAPPASHEPRPALRRRATDLDG